MHKIQTFNYYIITKSKVAFSFLKLTKMNFIGSTTLFYLIFHYFFRNSFYFEINDEKFIWPIESISDLRLIRGEFNSKKNYYEIETGYEGVDLMFIKNLIQKDDLVIDIGANKGFYTLLFSTLIGVNGKVFSFEASPNNYRMFYHRISRLWNLKNCLPFNYILTDTDNQQVILKKPSFFDDGTGFYFSRLHNGSGTSYSRKIDTLFNRLEVGNIKLLKIDVEGAEVVVLNGASQILGKTDLVLVEVSHTGIERFGTTVKELYNLLNNAGFNYSYHISISENQNTFLIKTETDAVGNILFSKMNLINIIT